MPEDRTPHVTSVVEVTEELMTEFEGRVPLGAVSVEVLQARRQLDGQVPSGALPELLHRLARHRLHTAASS